jgi:hypothetical protein
MSLKCVFLIKIKRKNRENGKPLKNGTSGVPITFSRDNGVSG